MITLIINKAMCIILQEKDKEFLDCMCGKSPDFIICDFEKTEEIDAYLRSYITDGIKEIGIIKYLK
jgi:hypothetical protein